MSADPAMADGLNWYRYAGNNSIMYTDPTGLYMWPGYGYGKAPPGHKKDEGSRNKESESNDNSNGESDSESSEEDNSSSESNNNTSGNYDPATRENGADGGTPAWQNPNGDKFSRYWWQTRPFTYNEKEFIRAVLGQTGIDAINKVSIDDVGLERAGSFNIGRIFFEDGLTKHMMGSNADANLLIHEVFHQVQYSTMKGSQWRLVKEFFTDNPYQYGYLNKLDTYNVQALHEIQTLEGQAEMVGDYAELYYKAITNKEGLNSFEESRLKRFYGIMGNSGYANTEAYIYLKRRYGW